MNSKFEVARQGLKNGIKGIDKHLKDYEKLILKEMKRMEHFGNSQKKSYRTRITK